MIKLLLIAAGGGAGSVLRYLMAGGVQRWVDGSFPLGTLSVNLAGCMAIGLLTPLLTGPILIREEYRLALLVGLLGGFTTFSTFGYETLALGTDGQFLRATLNIILSVALGLAATWGGTRLAQVLYGV